MKPRRLICLVTDRRRLTPESTDEESFNRLVALVGAAARAGIDMVQLREPDLEARQLEVLAERCVDAVAHGTRIVVNDRVDIALAAGADGVHLRADSVDAPTARGVMGPGFLIGRSVHGVDEAAAASGKGSLDYLVFGTVFDTASKRAGHIAAGLEPLVQICATVGVPVLAIGGITLDRAPAVVKAGAAGVAAIGLFLPPRGVPAERHLSETVKALRRVFDTCEALP